MAQSMDEIYVGTVPALAAMSRRGVSTSGLLQRYGLTPTASPVCWPTMCWPAASPRLTWSAWPRPANLSPVFHRETLYGDCSTCWHGPADVMLLGRPASASVPWCRVCAVDGQGQGAGRAGQAGAGRRGALLDDAAAPSRPGCARPRAASSSCPTSTASSAASCGLTSPRPPGLCRRRCWTATSSSSAQRSKTTSTSGWPATRPWLSTSSGPRC